LERVPLNQIQVAEDSIRSVDKDNDEFKDLVNSVRADFKSGGPGIRNPIQLAELGNGVDGKPQTTVDGKPLYILVDGLHRFTAACIIAQEGTGLTEVNASIEPAQTVSQRLMAQIRSNAHNVKTRPAEFGRGLKVIASADPTATIASIAAEAGKSVEWCRSVLSLGRLSKNVQDLIDSGTITLTNGIMLSKLPNDLTVTEEIIERAKTETQGVFEATCAELRTQHNEEKKGLPKVEPVFVPKPKLRSLDEITKLSPTQVHELAGGKTGAELVKFTLDYVTCMDDDTTRAKKAEWEANRASKAAAAEAARAEREKRQAEREAKKKAS
jgi:ParB-like chromosome segregation protein Spo0J